jgi:hypothetical protein
MSESKLVRVELELEDGTIMRLTGDDALKWSDMTQSQGTMADVYGCRYTSLPWEVRKVSKVQPKVPPEETINSKPDMYEQGERVGSTFTVTAKDGQEVRWYGIAYWLPKDKPERKDKPPPTPIPTNGTIQW